MKKGGGIKKKQGAKKKKNQSWPKKEFSQKTKKTGKFSTRGEIIWAMGTKKGDYNLLLFGKMNPGTVWFVSGEKKKKKNGGGKGVSIWPREKKKKVYSIAGKGKGGLGPFLEKKKKKTPPKGFYGEIF